jgi:hypothetical protein
MLSAVIHVSFIIQYLEYRFNKKTSSFCWYKYSIPLTESERVTPEYNISGAKVQVDERHPHLATQRFPLAGELVYYRCVLPGPLVLWKAPLNALPPTPDMDRTVSRMYIMDPAARSGVADFPLFLQGMDYIFIRSPLWERRSRRVISCLTSQDIVLSPPTGAPLLLPFRVWT